MNINFGLKSVAAKAATAATVPTPLGVTATCNVMTAKPVETKIQQTVKNAN